MKLYWHRNCFIKLYAILIQSAICFVFQQYQKNKEDSLLLTVILH